MDRKQLIEQVDEYFSALPPQERAAVEAMYEAFRARLLLEIHVDGYSVGGVVTAGLDLK